MPLPEPMLISQSEILWHSRPPENNFKSSSQANILYNEFGNHTSKSLPLLPGVKELKHINSTTVMPTMPEFCTGFPKTDINHHLLKINPAYGMIYHILDENLSIFGMENMTIAQ